MNVFQQWLTQQGYTRTPGGWMKDGEFVRGAALHYKLDEFKAIEQAVIEELDRQFPEDQVCSKLDEQVLDYLDDDWEADGYDDEWSWYCDHSSGEAESDVRSEIVNALSKVFPALSDDILDRIVREERDILDK